MKLLDKYEKYRSLYADFAFNPEEEVFFTTDVENFRAPEGFEDWKVQELDVKEYGRMRFEEIGINDDNNFIELTTNTARYGKSKGKEPIFSINKRGDIEILQFSLKREAYMIDKEGAKKPEYSYQKRHHPWHEQVLGAKYDFSNAKNVPFWSPELIEMFENETEVETLVITEGQFKARKACIDGIPTVGLTSISHFKVKGKIHQEIIDFMKTCKVKKVVILWDGDCRNISSAQLLAGEDISKRPMDFFNYARTIKDLILDYFSAKKVSFFFATINSYELNGAPKGIDDLLIQYQDKKEAILNDFTNIGDRPGYYIDWYQMNSEDGIKKLRKFFKLNYVSDFYEYHKEAIKETPFVWFKNTYKVVKGKPQIEVSADIKVYKRIGINYYKTIMSPVPSGKHGEQIEEEVLEPWSKTAILEDHPKEVISQIERFEGFTNIASHTDFQPVIANHWNLYYNINHTLEEGEWPMIRTLLSHLFEEHFENEMILDYLTILYRFPMQKLPVVCLVSKEQSTGKSTFIYLLKLIFKQNMAVISNNDLTSDFNSHWTSKLIVASEETLLEKKDGYEKIKSLSTAKEIMRNEKNKTAKSIPCMVHFVFCSNHEDDFIKIDDYDSRLWIRKVKSIKENIKGFDNLIESEIPAFLNFIANREIKYQTKGDRLWFSPKDFRTAAMENVIKNSEPNVIKEIRIRLEDYFLKHLVPELHMTAGNIRQYFGIRGEDNYLNKVIKSYLKVDRKKDKKGNDTVSTYWFFTDNFSDPEKPNVVNDKGRPFVFYANDFVKNFDDLTKSKETEEVQEAEVIEDSKQEVLPFKTRK